MFVGVVSSAQDQAEESARNNSLQNELEAESSELKKSVDPAAGGLPATIRSPVAKKNAPKKSSKPKNYEKSIKELEALLKKNPEDVDTHSQLGFFYLQAEQYDKAIQHLKEAAINPTKTNMFMLAEAYRKNKDFLNEIRTLEVLEQKNTKDPQVHELLGRAYFESKNMEKAAIHYRKALALDKKRGSAFDGLFTVFAATKNSYEQREILQDMLETFGDTPEVHTKMCRFLSQDSFFDKAIEHCKKAIELDRRIPENHVFLGMNYKGLKQIAQATKIIEQAAKSFPKSEFAQFTAGLVNDELKNWETSAHYYKRCIAADRESDRCYLGLAQGKLQTRDYKESLEAFIKACELNRSYYMALRNATSSVRLQKQERWVDKFQQATEVCGTKK